MAAEISVIIPVWNGETYVTDGLTSVFKQSFSDLEIIAVNDGSTDKTAQILEQLAAREPRLKVLHQPNQGAAAARNYGLDNAGGKYVFFLDSDDYLHPQALEILHDIMIRFKVPAVECRFLDIEDRADLVQTSPLSSADCQLIEAPLASLLERSKKFTPTIWNKLYLRSAIGDLRFPPCRIFEDAAFAVCLSAKIKTAAFTGLPLIHYYVGNTSLTRGKFKAENLEAYDRGFRYITQFFSTHFPDLLSQVRRRYISWYVRVMINAVRKSRGKQDDYPELERKLSRHIYQLFHDGVIGLRGLTWSKKLQLIKFLIKGKYYGKN